MKLLWGVFPALSLSLKEFSKPLKGRYLVGICVCVSPVDQ